MTLRLDRVRGWRRTCYRLAESFDEVMRLHAHQRDEGRALVTGR